MRADLLTMMNGRKDLAALDRDVAHLLGSWFNRGFLVLRRIDWSTPANILEQIIRYEAVHEIRDWDDLRRRIDPVDRRCYAFFHPAMADAPLIFVEVALTETIPAAIAPLLAVDRQPVADRARPHRGVLFDLQHPARPRRHFLRQLPDQAGGRGIAPRIAEARYLRDVVAGARLHAMAEDRRATCRSRRGARAAEALDEPKWFENAEITAQLRALLEPLAAHYFLKARTSKGRLIDSVARFHLGNGARLERINWLGDLSPKGLRESAGIMVNYLYRLDDIEKNHEAYANDGEVVASSAVKKLLKGEGRRLLDSVHLG